MWPFLVAAVMAGSGFLARSIIFRNGDQIEGPSVKEEEQRHIADAVKPSLIVGGEEGIFRFCSVGSKGGVRKKSVEGVENASADGVMKKSERGRRKRRGRVFSVCLKRRRVVMGCWNAFGKCDSSSSQGGSLFNWGIGVGLMCTVSAGKAEINKLNASINETKELIYELKQKLYDTKLSTDLQDSTRENQCVKKPMGENKPLEFITSDAEAANHAQHNTLRNQISDDCECASSVLTEESNSQLLEIDLLEAELESELQKMSCYQLEETADHRGENSDLAELVDKDHAEDENFFQSNGVSPYELDRKLCHLLIKQQDTKIAELQSKLESTRMKLHEREAELLSLKNCVRQFRDLSLETNSDEETEGLLELEVDNGRAPLVGMKRAMEFGSYDDSHANNVVEFSFLG